jgi:hypothetical protein
MSYSWKCISFTTHKLLVRNKSLNIKFIKRQKKLSEKIIFLSLTYIITLRFLNLN